MVSLKERDPVAPLHGEHPAIEQPLPPHREHPAREQPAAQQVEQEPPPWLTRMPLQKREIAHLELE